MNNLITIKEIKHNDSMIKKHKNTCMYLNYVEHKHLKKCKIKEELMPIAWHPKIWLIFAYQKMRKK